MVSRKVVNLLHLAISAAFLNMNPPAHPGVNNLLGLIN